MKKAILTIEGCNAISYLINTVLGKDYSVTSVKNPAAAMQHLQADLQKDLIIVDIPDKNSDNYALLEHISSSSLFGKIPTVVISNSDDERLKNKTVELGASLFLTKPFDPVYLSEQIRALIYEDAKPLARKKKTIFNLNIF